MRRRKPVPPLSPFPIHLLASLEAGTSSLPALTTGPGGAGCLICHYLPEEKRLYLR